jgi:DNA repair protein RAD16
VSVLQKVHWRRIICDEAHALKNKRCATAKAVFCLTAERRWCLSGTPLQNRVGEIFSLLRFLRYAPYALYYCKNCPCASLDYRFDEGGRHCELCGHSPLRHYNWLMRLVLNPIKMYGYSGPGRDAMVTLRKEVLDSVLLRRTKAGRSADLSLPGRLISVRNDLEMDAFEEDFYSALYTQTQAKFGGYVAAGTVLSNYAHIFDLLTRLRQAVNHPYLILYGNSASAGDADGVAAALTDVCGICREAVEDPVVTGCRHAFCRLCMREYLETLGGTALSMLRDLTHDEAADGAGGAAPEDGAGDDGGDGDEGELDGGGAGAGAAAGKAKGAKKPAKPAAPKKRPASAGKAKGKGAGAGAAGAGAGVVEEGGAVATCPTCFCELTVDLAAAPSAVTPAIASAAKRKSILARLPPDRVGAAFRSSTKIEALLEDLWAAQAEEPGLKAIVFSQFVNMLDLVQHRLTHAGVRCVKMDGGMSVPARDRVINAFRDDPHVTVFLISLKAGGVALHLTAASRIYLMDCWWNWASENQAMDRTHRLGQHRSITVVRFFVRNTIEERILALQERKKLVFDATVGQDNAATSKLTAEDMRFLFSR